MGREGDRPRWVGWGRQGNVQSRYCLRPTQPSDPLHHPPAHPAPLQIYLVAGNALPSFTGLAPQCGNFATAAAVAASGGVPDAACPTARQVACAQTQMRPDQQTLQSGAILRWPVNTGASAAGSSAVWQPPAAGSVVGRPARVQLSLEGGTPPAFTYYPALPEFPSELRTTSSFGMRFALDKPALLLYAGGWMGGWVG